MKKTALLIFALLITITTSGQKVEWTKLQASRSKYSFDYFYKVSQNDVRAIYSRPIKKFGQPLKSDVLLVNYSGNLTEVNELELPPESPLSLDVTSFMDYNVIFGSMDDNPLKTYSKNNRVVITDREGVVQYSQEFPLHGKNHKFDGPPRVILSEDSSCLIIVNTVKLFPDKPSFQEVEKMIYINIIDKNLATIWTDSVLYSKAFGKNTFVKKINFCYANGMLFFIGFQPRVITKKLPNNFIVTRFEKPGKSKIIIKESFEKGSISWKFGLNKNGVLCIGGLQTIGETWVTNGKRSLFMICKNVMEEKSEISVKKYNIDKTLLTGFPEVERKNLKLIGAPEDLLIMEDGVLCYSELSILKTSKSGVSFTYYINFLCMTKFDFDGDLIWIKFLKKSIASKQYIGELNSTLMLSNGRLHVFYYDYKDNINNEIYKKKMRVVGTTKLSLAHAVIDAEGNIKKEMIYNLGQEKVMAPLYDIVAADDGSFVLSGFGTRLSDKGFCIGTYKPDLE